MYAILKYSNVFYFVLLYSIVFYCIAFNFNSSIARGACDPPNCFKVIVEIYKKTEKILATDLTNNLKRKDKERMKENENMSKELKQNEHF